MVNDLELYKRTTIYYYFIVTYLYFDLINNVIKTTAEPIEKFEIALLSVFHQFDVGTNIMKKRQTPNFVLMLQMSPDV